mmetsp:Transcript_34940/g.58502  ORF Transcript_34940/g.58502 Transcript_34940/m.58502 type:complete len:634 (+) Transcript_34940:1517-3418(+)
MGLIIFIITGDHTVLPEVDLLILRLFLHADQRLECVLPVIIPCKLTSSPARLNAAQSILQQVLWRRALAVGCLQHHELAPFCAIGVLHTRKQRAFGFAVILQEIPEAQRRIVAVLRVVRNGGQECQVEEHRLGGHPFNAVGDLGHHPNTVPSHLLAVAEIDVVDGDLVPIHFGDPGPVEGIIRSEPRHHQVMHRQLRRVLLGQLGLQLCQQGLRVHDDLLVLVVQHLDVHVGRVHNLGHDAGLPWITGLGGQDLVCPTASSPLGLALADATPWSSTLHGPDSLLLPCRLHLRRFEVHVVAIALGIVVRRHQPLFQKAHGDVLVVNKERPEERSEIVIGFHFHLRVTMIEEILGKIHRFLCVGLRLIAVAAGGRSGEARQREGNGALLLVDVHLVAAGIEDVLDDGLVARGVVGTAAPLQEGQVLLALLRGGLDQVQDAEFGGSVFGMDPLPLPRGLLLRLLVVLEVARSLLRLPCNGLGVTILQHPQCHILSANKDVAVRPHFTALFDSPLVLWLNGDPLANGLLSQVLAGLPGIILVGDGTGLHGLAPAAALDDLILISLVGATRGQRALLGLPAVVACDGDRVPGVDLRHTAGARWLLLRGGRGGGHLEPAPLVHLLDLCGVLGGLEVGGE